eukprot:28198-Lingulodinium_polyedra.AAC.1
MPRREDLQPDYILTKTWLSVRQRIGAFRTEDVRAIVTMHRCDQEEVDRRQLSGMMVAIETDCQRGLRRRAEMFANMNVP